MKRFLFAAALLLVAPSAFAQVPVLTNADLGKPVKQRIILTPAQWQNFVAHQYVAVATPTWEQRYAEFYGPRVTIIPDSTPQPYIPPSYPLQAPFYMSTYVGPTIGVYPLGPVGHRHRH